MASGMSVFITLILLQTIVVKGIVLTDSGCHVDSMEVLCTVYNAPSIEFTVLPILNISDRLVLNAGITVVDKSTDTVMIRATLLQSNGTINQGFFNYVALLTVEPAIEQVEVGCSNGLNTVTKTIVKPGPPANPVVSVNESLQSITVQNEDISVTVTEDVDDTVTVTVENECNLTSSSTTPYARDKQTQCLECEAQNTDDDDCVTGIVIGTGGGCFGGFLLGGLCGWLAYHCYRRKRKNECPDGSHTQTKVGPVGDTEVKVVSDGDQTST